MRTKHFSKSCFYDALISLSKDYDYKDIQISQICKEAGFDRSTFYRAYKSKDDILIEKATELIKEFYEQRAGFDDNITKKCEYIFAFYRQHYETFGLLLKANLYRELQDISLKLYVFDELNSTYGDDIYGKVLVVNGVIAVLICWLERGMPESDESMAKRVLSVLNIKSYA